MSLTKQQVQTLHQAINCYAFPFAVYDFNRSTEISLLSIKHVEKHISKQLRSANISTVIDGLSNILYWGHYNAGYRDYRVKQFRKNVRPSLIPPFQMLVRSCAFQNLKQLQACNLPQFSGVSFLSKVAMFLDSQNLCVLDLQIAKLAGVSAPRSLKNLKLYPTLIPPTFHNATIYLKWCSECSDINHKYFTSRLRPVEIERGFFQLIQTGQLNLARAIYKHY